MSINTSLTPGASTPGDTPRTLWREDLIAGLTGFLLITGLFLDGWNHLNLQDGKAGEFLTPWHGLLYTGFNACAIWAITRNPRLKAMIMPSRGKRSGGGSLAASAPAITPAKIAFLGMALVALAVVGDGVTRDAGLRASTGAMAPPFDFLLFTGAGLVFAVGIKIALGRFVTISKQVALPLGLAVVAAGIALFAFGSPSSSTSKSAAASTPSRSGQNAGVAQVTPVPGVVQTHARAHGRATSAWTAAHRSGHTARVHAAAPAAAVHNDAPLTVAQTPSALPTTHQRHSASVVARPVVRRQVSAPAHRRAAAPAPAKQRAHRTWTDVAVPNAPASATQTVTTTTTTHTPDTPAPASAAKPSSSSSSASSPSSSPTPAAPPKHGGPGQN